MGITVELVGVGEGSGTFAGIWTLGNASCTPGGGVCAGTLGGKPAEGDPRSSTFHCWIVLGVFIGLVTEFGEQSWTITGGCTLDVGCMLVGCGCAGTLGGNQQLQKSGKFLLQHSLKPGILPFWGAGVSEFHCYFWLRSYSVMLFVSPRGFRFLFSLSFSPVGVPSLLCLPLLSCSSLGFGPHAPFLWSGLPFPGATYGLTLVCFV